MPSPIDDSTPRLIHHVVYSTHSWHVHAQAAAQAGTVSKDRPVGLGVITFAASLHKIRSRVAQALRPVWSKRSPLNTTKTAAQAGHLEVLGLTVCLGYYIY